MYTVEGENELLLTCREIPDGVAILRCETRDDSVRLPDEIGGAPVVVPVLRFTMTAARNMAAESRDVQ